MNKLTKVLLGTTFLTVAGTMPAAAVPFDESAATGGDFLNAPDGNPLPVGVDDVTGRLLAGLRGAPDDIDYFTFTGLTPGASYWLTFFDFQDDFPFETSLDFTIDGGAPAQPGVGMSTMVAGSVLPDGRITIGVQGSNNLFSFETYRVTLEIHDVPEPGALALFGAGLAGLGIARRRRKDR